MRAFRCRCRGLGVCCALAVVVHAETLISELPLSGNLVDHVTGTEAVFERAGPAYTLSAQAVPANAPRYEDIAVAGGYRWVLGPEADGRVPVAIAGGELFLTDAHARLWATRDGVNLELRSTLPAAINKRTAAWGTPAGSLLCASALTATETGCVYRSTDGGRTLVRVLQLGTGHAWHWNFATVNGALFISEYGPFDGDNARRIYRSVDDGATWEVAYEPDAVPVGWYYHNHQLLADPFRGVVYQSHGCTLPGILASADSGVTWDSVNDFYMPTAGVARADAIYWGHDGIGSCSVKRHAVDTGAWTMPLIPWNGYNLAGQGITWTGNIYTMYDHGGVLYAPFAREMNVLWASADGKRWALVRGMDTRDWGLYHFAGSLCGWIHALYYHNVTDESWHLRLRPGRVANLTGLRLEPACTNLMGNLQNSSAEDGLAGWLGSANTALAWDNTRAFHGQASIRVQNPNQGAQCVVICPALPGPVPVGTTVTGQIHLFGDESGWQVRFWDANTGQLGPATRANATDAWVPVRAELTVTNPNNRLQMLLVGDAVRPGVATVWVDAHRVTYDWPGAAWHPGGEPRAGERLQHAVAFPSTWTDFITYRTELSNADTRPVNTTIKAWVQDADHYAHLVFDSSDERFKLWEMRPGVRRLVCESKPLQLWPEWTCRCGVRRDVDRTELFVRIGSGQDTEAAVLGPALTIQPTALWIGSSPLGDDQAPGVYALSRTFAGALNETAIERELEYLPPGPLTTAGDVNCDGHVTFGDINPFVAALSGETAYYAAYNTCHYLNADCNGDGAVDFRDINAFVALLGRW